MVRLPTTGDQVGAFSVGDKVHDGALASLYAVTGPSAFPLLMKVPRLVAAAPVEGMLGFETEVAILATLTGPHLPRFVAAGDLLECPFLVMERVPGTTLAETVACGPCAIDELARLGAAISDALEDLHGQGAIHLDLKPDNLMVRPDGGVVLIDLGFAHHARLPDLLAEELRHQAGSAAYVSPEQLRGDRTDLRSDLFALGVILYELATGELPFGVPETRAGLRDRLWRPPVPPRARRPELPPWLQEVILRCLEVEAPARYQTAAHVAFDLRHPDQVALTARAQRVRRPRFWAQLRRWWRARATAQNGPRPAARQATPVIMVAVDTTHPDDPRQPALQSATRRLISLYAEIRLLCVSVVPGAVDGREEAGQHLDHLARLRRWTVPLGLPPERLSLHVLSGAGPAAAIRELARENHVDLLVLGAPGPEQSGLAWWRSVASSVAASAPCSVHLVRLPHAERAGGGLVPPGAAAQAAPEGGREPG